MSKIKIAAPKAVTQFQSSDGVTHESKAAAIAHEAKVQIGPKVDALLEALDINVDESEDIRLAILSASGSKIVQDLAATLTAYAPYLGGAKAKATAPKAATPAAPKATKAASPTKAAAPTNTGDGPMTIEAAKKLHKAYCKKRGCKPKGYAEAKAMVEAAQQAAADEKAAAKEAKTAAKPAATPKATKPPKAPAAPKSDDTGPMSLEEAEAMVERYEGKRGRKPGNFEKAQRIVAAAEGKPAPVPTKAPAEKAPAAPVTPPPTAGHRPPPPPPQSPE
jgi:hypothetical protein